VYRVALADSAFIVANGHPFTLWIGKQTPDVL